MDDPEDIKLAETRESNNDVDPYIGKTIAERYLVRRLIGVGGWGRVYEVEHLRMRKHFAMKLLHAPLALDPENKLRFKSEAEAISKIDHPNVARIIDCDFLPDGVPYMVMEMLDGRSLDEEMAATDDLMSPQRAVWIMGFVCDALDAVHRAGVVHRDLKPSNVFIAAGSGVKIIDFGLAKHAEGASLTETGTTLGTPTYMSPEQCQGSRVDHRSDIYTVGCILYEMLTSIRPFEGKSPYESMCKHTIGEVPEMPAEAHVPKALQQVVLKCLEKDPNDRYQSALALKLALLASLGGAGAEKTAIADAAGARGRLPVVLVVSNVVLLLGLIAVGLFVFMRKAPNTVPAPQVVPAAVPVAPPGSLKRWVYDIKYQGKSLNDYNKLIEEHPNVANWYYCRGRLYSMRDERENALRDYKKACSMMPFAANAWAQRAMAEAGLDQYDQALKDAKHAVELEPKASWGYQALAYAQMTQFLLDDAIVSAKKTLQIDPKNTSANGTLCEAYDMLGQHGKAVDTMKAFIEKNPELAKTGNLAGTRLSSYLYHQRKFEEGWKACQSPNEQMLRMNVLCNAACNEAALGRKQEALQHFEQALGVASFPAYVYRRRADLQYDMGDYQSALDDCGQTIALYPQYAGGYVRRARCYYQLGQYRIALEDVDHCLKLNPTNAWAYAVKAQILSKLGKHEEALAAADHSVKMLPDFDEAHAARAQVLMAMGRKDEAEKEAYRALEINPLCAGALAMKK